MEENNKRRNAWKGVERERELREAQVRKRSKLGSDSEWQRFERGRES